MSMVRSFSISWKRDRFCLTLYCFSPSGKEHLTTLYFEPASLEHLASSILKAVSSWKKGAAPGEEDKKYIG
jgi:hypothetical protein